MELDKNNNEQYRHLLRSRHKRIWKTPSIEIIKCNQTTNQKASAKISDGPKFT